MLSFWKIYLKLIKLLINLLFVLQITFMILIFLTAMYWFMDLANIDSFRFVEPLAVAINDFVRLFYTKNIEIGGLVVDGSLLLFDILSIILVLVMTKAKYYLNIMVESINFNIESSKRVIESQLNKKLQEDFECKIKTRNKVALLIKFEVKNMMVDSIWGGNADEGKEVIIEESFKVFYDEVKKLDGCNFSKTGDKILILVDHISKFDNLLNVCYLTLDRIRKNLRKKHWAFYDYISVALCSDDDNLKDDIPPILERLLGLRHKKEAICLGDFSIRYSLESDTQFTLFKKGVFDIIEENEVWILIKKN